MKFFRRKKDETPEWIYELEDFVNEVRDGDIVLQEIVQAVMDNRPDLARNVYDGLTDEDKDGLFWYMCSGAISLLFYIKKLEAQLGEYGDGSR